SITSSNAVLTVNTLSLPPGIVTPPQSQTVTRSNNATFTVVASGTAPLSYQWQFNTVNIAGATSTTYTRTNVQLADAGNFTVAVANAAGAITSSIAVLTVTTTNVPPSITAQPQPLTVNQGSNATFSVTATGTVPLSYQWQFNAANISGATTSVYSDTNAQ